MSLRTYHPTSRRLLAGFLTACGWTILAPAASPAAVTFSNTARLSVNVGSDGTQAIALADVNKDNRPDIIAVGQNTNEVSVLLNDGNGGFGGPPSAFNVGAGPVAVGTGDFDRDGNVDVVAVNGDSDTVTILFGDGTGSFNAGRRDYSVDSGPVSVAVADLNNDQIPDLAVLSDSTVYLLKSNGDQTFAPFSPASIATHSTGGFAIAAGLFNADAFPDLIISNIDSDNVSVFLGNGNGTFKAARLYNTGSAPAGVAVADFDGDGKQDIAVVDSGEPTYLNMSLFFAKGDGTFADDVRTTAEIEALAIAVADLDLDGRPDLAVTSSSEFNVLSIVLNSPTDATAEGGFVLAQDLFVGQPPVAVQTGDLNGDGRADVVLLGQDESTIDVLLNTMGNETPSPTATLTPTRTATATPTATLEPSPSATPTPLVRISVGSAIGRPGEAVDVTVSLVSSGVPVAATANDIVVANLILLLPNDPNLCRVNPSIGKSLVISTDPPPFEFEVATRVRVFVETAQHSDPIPDGPLYTCTFPIAPWALPDSYLLANNNVSAFGPAGTQLAGVAAEDGVLIVSLLPPPQPTRTPTATPTTTAATTAATTVPPGGGGGGCSIGEASTDAGPAMNVLGVLYVLLLARRVELRARRKVAATTAAE